MPIQIPNDLPAAGVLHQENIFVMKQTRAETQHIRPLEIVLLNLMPTKIVTETQLSRVLGNTPLQVHLELMMMSSHQSKNTPQEHLLNFYKTFDDLKDRKFDGMVITGAPVEQMPFEQVNYWKELCQIMEWSKTHVHSTFHICWGAQAGLYYHYGIDKHPLPEKLFGVYPHRADYKRSILLRGFDDEFWVPHSRHTTVLREDIEKVPDLKILASSEEGPFINLEPQDANLCYVLSLIKDFIVSTSTRGKRSIGELYNMLADPENRIGLKKGLIPIFFVAVLRYYKKYCVISKNGRELEITDKLFEMINDNPESYDLFLEDWDVQKDEYIKHLETLFGDYIVAAEKEYNNFTFIVTAMQRWYLQLPKYVKEIKNIYLGKNEKPQPCDSVVVKFLASLRNPEINARDFLFSKLLWVFGEKEFSENLGRYVARTKSLIDRIKPNLLQQLNDDLANIFAVGKRNANASLSSIVQDWTASLSEAVVSHMFNGNENNMLQICLNITPDENKFIEELARITTSLRIDDWSEITVEAFIKAVEDFVKTIKNFRESLDKTDEPIAGSYKITFIDENGRESYRTFDKAEYSKRAQLMYNDAAAMIEEYGESLSTSEKRQVLIDIINKLLG